MECMEGGEVMNFFDNDCCRCRNVRRHCCGFNWFWCRPRCCFDFDRCCCHRHHHGCCHHHHHGCCHRHRNNEDHNGQRFEEEFGFGQTRFENEGNFEFQEQHDWNNLEKKWF